MVITVHLDPDYQAALDQLVKLEGLSPDEVIRRAILERSARLSRQPNTDDAWAEIDEEYGDVLERLRKH